MGTAVERDLWIAVLLLVLDSLVGGNGTVWASSKTGYTYFSIDTASTPGYVTVA